MKTVSEKQLNLKEEVKMEAKSKKQLKLKEELELETNLTTVFESSQINNWEDLEKEVNKEVYTNDKIVSINIRKGGEIEEITELVGSSEFTRAIGKYDSSSFVRALKVSNEEGDFPSSLILREEGEYYFFSKESNKFVSLDGNKSKDINNIKGETFWFFGSSPSGLKGRNALYVSSQINDEDLYKTLTFGGSEFYKQYTNNEMVKSISGRESQCLPPSLDLGGDKSRTYAIVTKEIADGQLDGMSFLNETHFRKNLSSRLNKKIDVSLVGLSVQLRSLRSKTQGTLIKHDTFVSILFNIIREEGLNIFLYNKEEGSSEELPKDSLVIVGDFEETREVSVEELKQIIYKLDIAYISDANAVKSIWNLKNDCNVSILEVNTGCKNTVNTSVQMLEKAEAMPFLPLSVKKEGLSFDNVFDKCVAERHIRKLEKEVKQLNRSINRCSVPVKGSVRTLNGDIGALFNVPVLNIDEIYAPGIRSKEVLGVKYPSLGEKEYMMFKNITYSEIENRVNKASLSDYAKRSIIKYYREMGAGTATVSYNDVLKSMLAGMDFDYDQIVVVEDKEILKNYKQEELLVVNIINEKNKDTGKKLPVSTERRFKLFNTQLNNKKLSVGEATNINSKFVALKKELDNNSDFVRKQLMELQKYITGGENKSSKSKKYNPLPRRKEVINERIVNVIDISKEMSVNLEKEFSKLDIENINKKEINILLEDINALGRYYQESIIDQDKDLAKVVEILDMFMGGQKVLSTPMSMSHKVFTIEDQKIVKTNFVKDKEEDRYVDEIYLSNAFSIARLLKMQDEINELEGGEELLSDEEKVNIAKFYEELSERTKFSLEKTRKIYIDLMKEKMYHIRSINNSKIGEEEKEEKLVNLNKVYNELEEALASSFYKTSLTAGLNLKEAGMAALYLSFIGKNNNSFYLLMPELVYLASEELRQFSLDTKIKAKAFSISPDLQNGDVLKLVDGECNFLFTKEELSGEFIYENGFVYKEAKDLFAERINERIKGESLFFVKGNPLRGGYNCRINNLQNKSSVLEAEQLSNRAMNFQQVYGESILVTKRMKLVTRNVNVIIFKGSRDYSRFFEDMKKELIEEVEKIEEEKIVEEEEIVEEIEVEEIEVEEIEVEEAEEVEIEENIEENVESTQLNMFNMLGCVEKEEIEEKEVEEVEIEKMEEVEEKEVEEIESVEELLEEYYLNIFQQYEQLGKDVREIRVVRREVEEGTEEEKEEVKEEIKEKIKEEIKEEVGIDKAKELVKNNEKIAIAACDGSYNASIDKSSFGVIYFDSEGINKKKGVINRFNSSNNVTGEIYGALVAMHQAAQKGKKELHLYYDYMGVEKWATGEWKAKSPIAKFYKNEFNKLNIDVKFVKVKGHSGHQLNEEADRLASSAFNK